MGLLEGKKALILGVANERSIAWGIAEAFKEQKAQIGLTYLNENLKKRVEPLADKVNADFLVPMDVTVDDHYQQLNEVVKKEWGKFDILVHSLAFADTKDLKGRFHETSREGFKMACDISAFSLIGLCNALKDCMNQNGSVLAMTYQGSTRVMSHYSVMGVAKAALEASMRYLADDLGPDGIRVNCISAGPIKTLASSAVKGLRDLMKHIEDNAPMRSNVNPQDVANTALFLGSDLSQKVSGQILFVDSGQSIMGA